MKDMDKLENMTLWDITTNEGPLTLFVLGVACLFLSFMYLIMGIYYSIKFRRWAL